MGELSKEMRAAVDKDANINDIRLRKVVRRMTRKLTRRISVIAKDKESDLLAKAREDQLIQEQKDEAKKYLVQDPSEGPGL